MSSESDHDHDVVIAGAGPVGLLLACELRLAGCSVLVLERAASASTPLKTLPFGLRGLTLPTIESLDRRDLLAALRTRAGDAAAVAPWTGGARRPAGHFAGLQFFRDRVDESRWPWRAGAATGTMAVSMADLEAVLADRARALGASIRYDLGVDAVAQADDAVTVHAGAERLRAGWLVGCDGGRSTVRKAAGIGFAGTEPEFTGYSLRLTLAAPHELRAGRQHTATGMYTYAPPDAVTMIEFDGGAHHRGAPLTRDHVEAVLRRVSGTDVRVESVDLATTWTDRAYLATAYRDRRVLLAGDAAHVHAPLGGQGLNLGLGDAMNLGWKLGAVAGGRAGEDLLDSYAAERRPVAEQVLDWSRAQVALLRPGAGTAALRSLVRDLMETRDGATYFAGRLWGADLRYDPGAATRPLVGRSAPDLTLGDGRRVNEVLRSGRPLLIDLDPAAPLRAVASRWSARLDYVAGPASADPNCDALLVRPDGMVAWAGSAEADAVDTAAAILLEA